MSNPEFCRNYSGFMDDFKRAEKIYNSSSFNFVSATYFCTGQSKASAFKNIEQINKEKNFMKKDTIPYFAELCRLKQLLEACW